MARSGSTFLTLVAVHALSFVVLWPAFALLRWTGENGLSGLGIRVVASALILAIALVGSLAIEDPKNARRTMGVSIALLVFYVAITFGLAAAIESARMPKPAIIFPRIGAIRAPSDFVSLLVAAIINPSIVLMFMFGRSAFAANRQRERDDLQRKLGPGATPEEAEAIRKMLEIRAPR